MKKLFIFILFLLFAGSSFAQSDYGTYLSRICEFDVKNVKGLTNTENFIITYEHILYSLDKNGGIDVSFHYNWQLRIMRNAFYARYKYRFKDNMLIEIFYEPFWGYVRPDNWFNANFTEELFSPIEKRNIETIQRLENMLN